MLISIGPGYYQLYRRYAGLHYFLSFPDGPFAPIDHPFLGLVVCRQTPGEQPPDALAHIDDGFSAQRATRRRFYTAIRCGDSLFVFPIPDPTQQTADEERFVVWITRVRFFSRDEIAGSLPLSH